MVTGRIWLHGSQASVGRAEARRGEGGKVAARDPGLSTWRLGGWAAPGGQSDPAEALLAAVAMLLEELPGASLLSRVAKLAMLLGVLAAPGRIPAPGVPRAGLPLPPPARCRPSPVGASAEGGT